MPIYARTVDHGNISFWFPLCIFVTKIIINNQFTLVLDINCNNLQQNSDFITQNDKTSSGQNSLELV